VSANAQIQSFGAAKPAKSGSDTVDDALAPLVIGFSGGGDSLALLLRLRADGRDLRPVVVDHALRSGSDAAAAQAAELAAQAGYAPEVVRLTWRTLPSGQAAWRAARLKALGEAAHRHGAKAIALGHTADDQAETVLLRLERASGWRGLAGMAPVAPVPLWPEGRGLTLWRPLLTARRATLRASLRAAGWRWLEDPANADARFGRVRARARLAEQPDLHEALIQSAQAAQATAALIDRAALRLARAAVRSEEGRLTIAWAVLAEAPPAIAARLLAAALTAAGAASRAVEEPSALRVLQRLGAGERALTVAGAKLEMRGAALLVSRDPGAVLGRAGGPAGLAPVALPAGRAVIWDGRVHLRAAEPGWWAEADHTGGLRLRQSATSCAEPPVCVSWLLQERLETILWRGRDDSDSQ